MPRTWKEDGRMVLDKLDTLDERTKAIDAKLDHVAERQEERLDTLCEDVAGLRVTAGLTGGVTGMIGTIVILVREFITS